MPQLPHIEIIIDGITYDNTFQRDVAIDQTNLNDELATHAEKYAYYGFLAAIAATKAAYAKMESEQLYARIDHEKRRAAQQVPGFKYTEKMAENEVITDPRYIEQQKKYLDTKLLSDQLTEAARAMAQRREMLVQLGGISRQQMSPQRVVEQQAEVVHGIMNRPPAPAPAPNPPPTPPQPVSQPEGSAPAAPARRRRA